MMSDKAIKRLAFNSIQYKELKPMVLQPYMVIILCASPPKIKQKVKLFGGIEYILTAQYDNSCYARSWNSSF